MNDTNGNTFHLSLIVTTYNRPGELQRLLDSVAFEDGPYSFEVILINQGTPLPEVAKLFEQKGWQLIEMGRQMPLSAARNIGLEKCSGQIIGFPDDDCWYAAGFIPALMHKFEASPAVDAFCVNVFDPISDKPYGSRPLNTVIPLSYINVMKLPVSVGIFVRSVFVERFKLRFNENIGAGTYFGGGEETAFMCSFLKRGAKIIYNGYLSVFHEVDNYDEISLAKVEKYSRGYGYIAGNLILEKRYVVFPSFVYFILKSLIAFLVKIYKKKYRHMYYTRLKFFFSGIRLAYKGGKSIF